MKLYFWAVGQKHDADLTKAIEQYTKKIGHYYNCQWQLIAPPKNAGNMLPDALKLAEAELIMKQIDANEYLVLLDERGKMIDSMQLANQIEQLGVNGHKNIHFLIGGAFGVADSIRKRASFIWQLSALVFPHQLVRLIIVEQIYRACSIIRNEKYHHQ